MKFKSLIYSTKYGKDFGRWAETEAQDIKEAVKKFDALTCKLSHGVKNAITFTKPIAL